MRALDEHVFMPHVLLFISTWDMKLFFPMISYFLWRDVLRVRYGDIERTKIIYLFIYVCMYLFIYLFIEYKINQIDINNIDRGRCIDQAKCS